MKNVKKTGNDLCKRIQLAFPLSFLFFITYPKPFKKQFLCQLAQERMIAVNKKCQGICPGILISCFYKTLNLPFLTTIEGPPIM